MEKYNYDALRYHLVENFPREDLPKNQNFYDIAYCIEWFTKNLDINWDKVLQKYHK